MIKKSFLVLALIFLLMFFPSIIQAQTKSLFIPAYAFLKKKNEPIFGYEAGYIWLKETSPITQALVAQVQLPEGAIISKILIRYLDNGDSGLQLELYRRNMYNDKEQYLAQFSSLGSDPSWRMGEDSSITFPKVSNSGYCYYLHLGMYGRGLDYRFAGIKILYVEQQGGE